MRVSSVSGCVWPTDCSSSTPRLLQCYPCFAVRKQAGCHAIHCQGVDLGFEHLSVGHQCLTSEVHNSNSGLRTAFEAPGQVDRPFLSSPEQQSLGITLSSEHGGSQSSGEPPRGPSWSHVHCLWLVDTANWGPLANTSPRLLLVSSGSTPATHFWLELKMQTLGPQWSTLPESKGLAQAQEPSLWRSDVGDRSHRTQFC